MQERLGPLGKTQHSSLFLRLAEPMLSGVCGPRPSVGTADVGPGRESTLAMSSVVTRGWIVEVFV